jgi:predicted DNA-binding transcriptional regulator AlpA
MEPITFNQLPQAVQTILEQLQELNQKFNTLNPQPIAIDENRFVDINEIRHFIFPQWKRQTIYNKVCSGELPHSRMGARLMFNLKECREWRDEQLQKGKIKALSQIQTEAQAFYEKHKHRFQQ